MNYARLPEPREEPLTPAREGVLELEEVWLAVNDGDFKFHVKPDLGSVRCKLRYPYRTPRGGGEAFIKSIHISSPGEVTWEEIPSPYVSLSTQWLFFAAEELLNEPEVARALEAQLPRNPRKFCRKL